MLVDEALSVGDARFKRKSLDRMRALCDRAGTILLVSHALGPIRELCSDVLWLHKGRVVKHGEAGAVLDAYSEFLDVGDADVALEDL